MNNKKKFSSYKYNSIKSYYLNYVEEYILSINSIDFNILEKISKLLVGTFKKNKKLFVCGNGGSAAISNHFLCDFAKYVRIGTNLKPKIISLSSNVEIITAIGNDMDFNKIFSYQLENLISKDDVLLVISSSGNSSNIIEAIKEAKKVEAKVISFTGFNGGYAKMKSDLSLHVNANNYGLSEDSHQMIMHILCQFIRQKFLKNIKNKTIF
jgi:D-sedoheptulose 7-phosphate isomerase